MNTNNTDKSGTDGTADQISTLRAGLENSVRLIGDLLENDEVSKEDKVSAAMLLWELSGMAQEALEPFKAELREMAERNGKDEVLRIATDDGVTVTVTPQAKRFTLRKNADLSALRGSPLFADLVEKNVSFKMRRGADLSKLDADARLPWLDQVEETKPTSRVSFVRKDTKE